MLYTTIHLAKNKQACADGFEKVVKSLGGEEEYGLNTPIPLSKIMEVSGLADAIWAMCATTTDSQARIIALAIRFAELSLPCFEQSFPRDQSVRHALRAARSLNSEAIRQANTQLEESARIAGLQSKRAAMQAVVAAGYVMNVALAETVLDAVIEVQRVIKAVAKAYIYFEGGTDSAVIREHLMREASAIFLRVVSVENT